MKVLQINAVNGIGSTGRICVEIESYLNDCGHKSYIAYSVGLKNVKGYKIGSWLDRKIHGVLSRIFGLQSYYSTFSTNELLLYITKLKPDIVHLHNLHANYINLNLLLNYLAKNDIPTVITLHDCWFYTGKCTHYTVDNCFKWHTGCSACPRLKKDNPSWFFDRTNKMHEDKKKWLFQIPQLCIIGVSDWITNEAKKSFLSNAKVITRIYNWIDLETFKPVNSSEIKNKLGIEDKFIILGVASGWSEARGLDKFIELSKIITVDMVIVLVGHIRKPNILPSNIIHIPETHSVYELVEYYSMADVYVHLSLEDTFGKTIAEALACGTPSIVYNSTACPELIGDGCGYIVDTDDTNGIYKSLDIIKSNGKKFYTKNCINFVRENFNYSHNVSQLLQQYQNLLK